MVQSAPTVRRRRLGAKLRELRGDMTLEEVVEASGGAVTVSQLSRWETAKNVAQPKNVTAVLDVYVKLGREVDDDLRKALLTLTREGARRGWWQSYRSILTPAYQDLITMEADASSVRTWQSSVVPGLLQTGEYARELITSVGMTEAVKARVDALAEVRLARQAVLVNEDPLRLWAIIGEAALHADCAEGVMREQLGRLLSLGRRPTITIQVLPTNVAPHVGLMGAFSILGMESDHPDLDVCLTESLTSMLYHEARDEVGVYQDAFERLRAVALSPEQSAQKIAKIRDQHS
ncbi:Scr1 family TA system antitoxin-like transcriptional regulator [Streptomyces albidoflavus]